MADGVLLENNPLECDGLSRSHRVFATRTTDCDCKLLRLNPFGCTGLIGVASRTVPSEPHESALVEDLLMRDINIKVTFITCSAPMRSSSSKVVTVEAACRRLSRACSFNVVFAYKSGLI